MRKLSLILILSCAFILSNKSFADEFEKGSMIFSASAGQQIFSDREYIVIGAGMGYFVADGFETSFALKRWFGDSPAITEVKPGLRYIFHQVPSIKPFLGTFFRHWFIGDDYDDTGSVGGYAGIISPIIPKLNFSLSYVYEKSIYGCDTDCTDSYPELGFSFSF